MASCDCCGRQVVERSMSLVQGVVEGVEKTYFVCLSCDGYYETEELLAKCAEQETSDNT
jgi:hypothetical protein